MWVVGWPTLLHSVLSSLNGWDQELLLTRPTLLHLILIIIIIMGPDDAPGAANQQRIHSSVGTSFRKMFNTSF